ncbi:MAG: hypothetical protein IPK80_04635 [Nannocystis sp.]|jgi:hypothetical protein|nr:hypothetical protein [Nannocystis sp.]
MRQHLRVSLLALVTALSSGLCLGLACKSGGSSSPGDVRSVEGPSYCPRSSVPRKGASCPRGNSDFCVYRTSGGDFACVCGGGTWSCAAK